MPQDTPNSSNFYRASQTPRWYEQILEVFRRVLDGYMYIPAVAGAPTATPTVRNGTVPIVYDTTNDDMYVYNGGWKQVMVATVGTWTVVDASGASLTITNDATARYTKVGKIVIATFAITYPATASGANAKLGGLPFTSNSTMNDSFSGCVAYTNQGAGFTIGVVSSATTFEFLTYAGTLLSNANLSGKLIRGTIIYEIA